MMKSIKPGRGPSAMGASGRQRIYRHFRHHLDGACRPERGGGAFGSLYGTYASPHETHRPKQPAGAGRRKFEGDYCPYCGQKVEPDFVFCPSCGKSI